jgi:hypothetical protein
VAPGGRDSQDAKRDRGKDAAPIVRGQPQALREDPQDAAPIAVEIVGGQPQEERENPSEREEGVRSDRGEVQKSECDVGSPITWERRTTSTPQAADPITLNCRVTYLEDGKVYIHSGSTDREVEDKIELGELSNTRAAYPTDAAVRAKEARDVKEKVWKETGDTAAIKENRKRKPQEQESHYDDCGEDCTLLEEHDTLATLTMSQEADSVVEASFYDDVSLGSPVAEMYNLIDGNFELHYLLGSDGDMTEDAFKAKCHNSVFVTLPELKNYLTHKSRRGMLDVMEICGGSGGVSKISIRRRLLTGQNFDIVSGGDLTKPENVKHLMEYIKKHKPLVVVMGPPCTAMGG